MRISYRCPKPKEKSDFHPRGATLERGRNREAQSPIPQKGPGRDPTARIQGVSEPAAGWSGRGEAQQTKYGANSQNTQPFGKRQKRILLAARCMPHPVTHPAQIIQASATREQAGRVQLPDPTTFGAFYGNALIWLAMLGHFASLAPTGGGHWVVWYQRLPHFYLKKLIQPFLRPFPQTPQEPL